MGTRYYGFRSGSPLVCVGADRGDRQKLYTKGGILSVTSRILVVDLLTSIILLPATFTWILK